jgi:hypothetical protein
MNLQTVCENAAATGRSIDLAGCDYGPHKRSAQFLGVQPYYHFLAGFVRSLHLRKVLEIGTSYGGSMMAIHRGCERDQPDAQLVTVDKVDIAGKGLTSLADVRRFHGDSLASGTLQEIAAHLTSPIDFLYIDSKHSYDHTDKNLTIYGAQFRPRFVILDDIHLNSEMETLWADIRDTVQQYSYDASELAQRPTGFGVLDYVAAKEALRTGELAPANRQAKRQVGGLGNSAYRQRGT